MYKKGGNAEMRYPPSFLINLNQIVQYWLK